MRKAVKKGVTEKLVEQTVEDALDKSAGKPTKAAAAKKQSKAVKKPSHPRIEYLAREKRGFSSVKRTFEE